MLLQSVRQVLFTPRYLKSEGILRRNTRLQRNTSVTVDRKMTKNSNTKNNIADLWHYWRGLGGWNFYFLLKFALLWFGYLNFDALSNLIFLAFCFSLYPMPVYTAGVTGLPYL